MIHSSIKSTICESVRAMFDSIIKLVAVTKSVNHYGDTIETETERTIFAQTQSISQSEFYQAQAVGLMPEIKFTIADYLDYHNEQKLKFKPYQASEEEYYTIIRTYQTGNGLELVCKRGID